MAPVVLQPMGDPYEVAMQLLLAERPSQDDVFQAAALLEEASCEGHAGASERCALLAALGVTGPPDLALSLDLLALSAGQGSRSAQEQILLLADNQVDPNVTSDAGPEHWTALRISIPIAERMQSGEKLELSETPLIRVIKQFATAAECRWIISTARPRLAAATVYDKASGGLTHHAARDNSFFALHLGEMSVLTEVIRNRISAATGLPVPLFEPSQVLHYSVGQRFKPHHDFLDPANLAYSSSLATFGQRIATFLIYLNHGYGGGETSFPAIGLNYRAEEGDALFFTNVTRDGAPDPKTLHAGLPPTSGEKWVYSQWIRDRFPGQ